MTIIIYFYTQQNEQVLIIMPEITKNQLKHIRLLKQKKFRNEFGEFIIEGEKNVEELLQSNFKIIDVFATKDWQSDYCQNEITLINSKQLSQISNLATPNYVIAIAEIPKFDENPIKFENEIILMLDSINDPGNLGTIIRTANWFGIRTIVCSKNSVDCFNPKVVQASKGSLFKVKVNYQDLSEVLNNCKVTVYGASLSGQEIDRNLNFDSSCILLMGSESHGISKELYQYITNEISIKKIGHAESLNVAIATGIILNEITKP